MEPNERSKIAGMPPAKPDYSHAIETAYRDYLFRSRLEAKWAVFFDLCGWAWSYEPKDFRGWIPDFAIGEHPVLVEIKPFWHDDEWSDAKEKIMASGCDEPVLLLGNDPTWRMKNRTWSGETCCPPFGILFDQIDREYEPGFWDDEDVHFGFTEGGDSFFDGRYGLCPLDGGWWNLIWKAPEDYHHPNKWSRVWPDLKGKGTAKECVERMWAQACNASRWVKHES